MIFHFLFRNRIFVAWMKHTEKVYVCMACVVWHFFHFFCSCFVYVSSWNEMEMSEAYYYLLYWQLYKIQSINLILVAWVSKHNKWKSEIEWAAKKAVRNFPYILSSWFCLQRYLLSDRILFIHFYLNGNEFEKSKTMNHEYDKEFCFSAILIIHLMYK